MYGIIATWRMALEGISKADAMLKEGAMPRMLLKLLFEMWKILNSIKCRLMVTS